jgi:hypothetical protein
LTVLDFFDWMNNLGVSVAIRESVWMSPLVNVAHLVALVMFIGAVLIVDLKLVWHSAVRPGVDPWPDRRPPLRQSRGHW